MQLLIGTGEPEGAYCVIPEKTQEHDGAIEKIAMKVLQDEREPGFAPIVAMCRLTHGASRRVHEKRAVISLAIVVAGDAEAERERQDQQGRRKMPPAKVEQRRVKGREI